MKDYELQTPLISIPSRLKQSDSGAYRERLWEVGVVLVEQFLALERRMRVRKGIPTQRIRTHSVEHISESTDSSGLLDEWVTEDLVPLWVTVEVLQAQSPGQ